VAEIYPLDFLSPYGDSKAFFEGDMKYVWSARKGSALFDISRDPGETEDLVERHPRRAAKMEKKLFEYLAGLPGPASGGENRVVDEETRKALKGLGYLK
jgi:hypothetical protein